MTVSPAVSFVIATHNRCAATLETLSRLAECGISRSAYETIVVDNASTDGTPDAVAREFPDIRLLRLDQNRGSVAKNLAIEQSRGKYLVCLDDDSFPLAGSIERMIRHFQRRPRLGAASFTVTLPNGARECSAYPDVFIGCGVGLRRAAIEEVGRLPDDFFMQAEEYDVSLRLLDAGWDVQSFEDLRVTHNKSPAGRSTAQKMRLDVRNNLLLVLRRFPAEWREAYVREWMTRYWAMASAAGRRVSAMRGFVSGAARHLVTQIDQPVSDRTFERFSRLDETRARIAEAKRQYGLRRVLLIDWGKNLFAYRRACELAGIGVVAIADPKLAGQTYHNLLVLTDAQAAGLAFDAAIVSNLSPVHAAARLAQWRSVTELPVIDLFEADRRAAAAVEAA